MKKVTFNHNGITRSTEHPFSWQLSRIEDNAQCRMVFISPDGDQVNSVGANGRRVSR